MKIIKPITETNNEIEFLPIEGLDDVLFAKTPITNAQLKALFPDEECEGGPNEPRVRISYNDIQILLEKMNEDPKAYGIPDGFRVDLPTDEEWQHASGEVPDKLSEYAVYGQSNITDVATKKPNQYGLYDMLGLVWEWTKTGKEQA